MTKERAPLSVEQALQRVAGQLPCGVDSMAETADRKAGTVRAWMDPDRPEQVSLDAAIDLDLAYQAAGGHGAPLFEAFGAKLDIATASRFRQAHRLHDFAHGVIKEGGEAHAAIVAASRHGAGPAEFRTAYREACEAYEKLRDIISILEIEVSPRPKSDAGDDLAQAP